MDALAANMETQFLWIEHFDTSIVYILHLCLINNQKCHESHFLKYRALKKETNSNSHIMLNCCQEYRYQQS